MLVSRAGDGSRRGRCPVWRFQSRRQTAHHHSPLGRASPGVLQLQTVRLAKKHISRKGATRVQVDVTNTGKRAGSEVVQMYIRDLVSSVTRPIKELKAFQKISLQPGET